MQTRKEVRKRMRLIDWLIKLLVNYKYKKESFMSWNWGIDEHNEINIITAEYYDTHFRYGTRTEVYSRGEEYDT